MATLTVQTEAFSPGETIPEKYTGEGEDISPPIRWSDVPDGTKELALIMDDPDAPNTTWVHWVLYRIPADVTELEAGIPTNKELETPAGALQGTNSWDNIGYGGPMPPPGHGTHHYHFKVYALAAPVELAAGATKEQLLGAMEGHILAQGEVMGTYER